MRENSPPTDDENSAPDAEASSETTTEIDRADLATVIDEITQNDLSALTPEEGLEMYKQVRKDELTDSTIRTQDSRLSYFIEWCDEVGITNLNKLTGRDLLRFRTWRSENLRPVSIKANMRTLRLFLEQCVKFDAVARSLPEKVDIPSVDEDDVSRDEFISSERAELILEHLDKYEYATTEHVVWLLMTAAGLRLSGIRSIDLDDISPASNGSHLQLVHRPDSDTPLKNKSRSERIVHVSEYVSQVLTDYIDNQRPDVTDQYGREPLVASNEGRIVGTTIRKYAYKWSRPCVVTGECPHGVPDDEIDDCEAMQSGSHAYKCPGSSSPHTVRRGYITHELDIGVPKQVISDRCDVSSEVIDTHYDKRSEEERMELRTDIRESTYTGEDDSGYGQ